MEHSGGHGVPELGVTAHVAPLIRCKRARLPDNIGVETDLADVVQHRRYLEVVELRRREVEMAAERQRQSGDPETVSLEVVHSLAQHGEELIHLPVHCRSCAHPPHSFLVPLLDQAHPRPIHSVDDLFFAVHGAGDPFGLATDYSERGIVPVWGNSGESAGRSRRRHLWPSSSPADGLVRVRSTDGRLRPALRPAPDRPHP